MDEYDVTRVVVQTAIVPGQRQGYIISVTNKTVGSPDFDTTSLCTNVVYNRQVSSSYKLV